MNPKRVAERLSFRAPREGVGHTPPLLSVWVAGGAAIIVAGGLGCVLYYFVRLSPAVLGAAPIEVLKITLTLMAALGAVLTGVYAYRKQRLGEGDAARADADQFTQRYSSAAEQLGHDKAAVRLAGVYAMARLADDWGAQRQQCIDVLCAYLRMPAESDVSLSEGEVRETIVRTVASRLRDHSAISWVENEFDFTGAAFHDADFHAVTFAGERTSFDRASFSGRRTSFEGAAFSGGFTSFAEATFTGDRTSFAKATFSGEATSFDRTLFSGSVTSFAGATFSGQRVWFADATFSGEETDFDNATFSGNFTGLTATTFSGIITSFAWATFSGRHTNFDRATFSGSFTGFDEATFSAELTSFDDGTFSGEFISFAGTTFSGSVTSFAGATFSGQRVWFAGTTFPGGTTADEATMKSSFLCSAVSWGPISPRLLPALDAVQ